MAIGDSFGVILGTATTNRQPSSGVEEQLMGIAKANTNDGISIYDGTKTVDIITAARDTNEGVNDAAFAGNRQNLSLMINNAVYLRKGGTTDNTYVCGVQPAT